MNVILGSNSLECLCNINNIKNMFHESAINVVLRTGSHGGIRWHVPVPTGS